MLHVDMRTYLFGECYRHCVLGPILHAASLTDNSIQLIMYLHPGSSQLQSAELLPGLFNIVEDVAAAKASSKFGVVSALSVLLSAVQLRLRDHWGQSHAMVQTHQG